MKPEAADTRVCSSPIGRNLEVENGELHGGNRCDGILYSKRLS